MRGDDLLRAMSEIDDELIAEGAEERPVVAVPWGRWAALAAGVVVVALAGLVLSRTLFGGAPPVESPPTAPVPSMTADDGWNDDDWDDDDWDDDDWDDDWEDEWDDGDDDWDDWQDDSQDDPPTGTATAAVSPSTGATARRTTAPAKTTTTSSRRVTRSTNGASSTRTTDPTATKTAPTTATTAPDPDRQLLEDYFRARGYGLKPPVPTDPTDPIPSQTGQPSQGVPGDEPGYIPDSHPDATAAVVRRLGSYNGAEAVLITEEGITLTPTTVTAGQETATLPAGQYLWIYKDRQFRDLASAQTAGWITEDEAQTIVRLLQE